MGRGNGDKAALEWKQGFSAMPAAFGIKGHKHWIIPNYFLHGIDIGAVHLDTAWGIKEQGRTVGCL